MLVCGVLFNLNCKVKDPNFVKSLNSSIAVKKYFNLN